MLWFNDRKDLGFIRTDEGERLSVLGSGFAHGHRPTGRCAESVVQFEIQEKDQERQAVGVRFVVEDAPRRARRRGSALRTG